MAQIGELNATITADSSSFMAGVNKATGGTAQLRKSFNVGIKKAAKYTAALGATGAAITAGLVRSGLQAVDQQAKLARAVGGSTAALQGLTRTAERAGVSKGMLSTALGNLNKRLGEAEKGTGTAADTLKTLGLEASTLSGMDIDERMAALSQAMIDAGMNSQQMAFSLRELGVRNKEIVNLMQEGGEAILGSTKMVKGFGIAVSEVEAAKIEAANDAMGDIKNVIQGVSNQMAIQFAPLLDGVAVKLTAMANEAGGFSSAIQNGMKGAVSVTAFLLDAIEGIKRTFEVAGKSVATFALGFKANLQQLNSFLWEGPIAAIKALIDAANKIPGVNIPQVETPKFVEDLRAQTEEAKRAATEGMNDIVATLERPMPGASIRRFVDDVAKASQEAADKTVESRRNENTQLAALNQEMGASRTAAAQEAFEKEQEMRRQNLEDIRTSLLTEREAQIESQEKKLEQLRLGRENELLTEQEFNKLKEDLSQQHQDKLSDIEKAGLSQREKFQKMSMANQVGTVTGELERMTAGVADSNKTMFEINKAAGISSAIVNAYKGFSESLSAYPMPIAAAMAASHLASGMAAVSKIKSQSFGGGGGTSAPPSRTASVPTNTAGAGQQEQSVTRNINLSGDGLTQQFIRQLVPELNEASGDGVRFRTS